MIIQHNIPGINATRNKGISEGKLRKNLEKLSSGYRINRAGDDAAGLALSEKMRCQMEGLEQSLRNCNDGISMTNTGDGALTEVHAMLQRLQTLANESANGTYNTVARGNLDQERVRLLDEIDASDNLPAGFTPPELKDSIDLQIGPTAEETLAVERFYMSSKALLLDSTDFTTQADANAAVDTINVAIEAVADVRAAFGAAGNRMQHAYANLSVENENITAAESQIRDTDMAQEYTYFTKENIVLQSANAMNAQANSIVQSVLSLLQ